MQILGARLVFAIAAALIAAALIAAVSAACATVFMLLWNFAIAATFALPTFTFLKAWAVWAAICMVASLVRSRGAK